MMLFSQAKLDTTAKSDITAMLPADNNLPNTEMTANDVEMQEGKLILVFI